MRTNLAKKEKVQVFKDYKEKANFLVKCLEEKKAQDIVALDVFGIASFTEALIFATAVNARHAQTLTDWLVEKLEEQDEEILGIEGYRNANWILIDCNDVIVHIFQKEYREFYNLESMWINAPRLI